MNQKDITIAIHGNPPPSGPTRECPSCNGEAFYYDCGGSIIMKCSTCGGSGKVADTPRSWERWYSVDDTKGEG